MANIPQSKKY